MIRVAIVDDDEAARLSLAQCLKYVEETQHISFSIRRFSSGTAFLFNYQPVYDLVFMDIDMPGEDGFSVAKRWRKIDPLTLLVFVTNMAQLAVKGYEVDAVDFIVKPLSRETFTLKMRRVFSRLHTPKNATVQVSDDGVIHILLKDHISFFETQGHYIVYHTVEGDFREYSSLGNAIKKVSDDRFFQCNRGTVINFTFVKEISQDSLVVFDKQIPISRSLKKPFMESYARFLGGNK